MIALVALVALIVGIGLGWYLRRVNAWCPQCGDALSCPGCGGRPAWLSPGRTHRESPPR